MSDKPWEKIDEEVVYSGWRDMVLKTFKRPDGKIHKHDVMKPEGEYVTVFPVTTEGDIVLFKQFRAGPEKVFFELPGGGIDEGETPAEAAARELKEETGYEGEVEYLGPFHKDANIDTTWHWFMVRNCKKLHEQELDEHEVGEVVVLSPAEFRNKVESGQMGDLGLGFYGLEKIDT